MSKNIAPVEHDVEKRTAQRQHDALTEYYQKEIEKLRPGNFPINLFGLYSCPEHGQFHVMWWGDETPPAMCCPACGEPLWVAK